MKDVNEIIAYKHSAMIQTNAKNLTLVQRKVINALIYVIQKTGDQREYSVNTADLKKICGITSVGNDELKKHLKALTQVTLEFNYLGKDKDKGWQVMVLLSGAELLPESNSISFSFSPFLQKKILNPNMYTPLKILMIASLKNRYSIILYEFLRDYKEAPHGVPKLEIEKFKDLMGVDNNKYKRFYDFKKNVLNVSVDEINEKTDLSCSYKLFAEFGHKYSHIKFDVENNQKFDFKLSHGSNESIENKNQLKMKLDENSLKISKEFFVSNDLLEEWSDKIGSEKLDELYEYTKAKKPKNPAGYMRSIIESGADLNGISQISKEEKIKNMKTDAQGCMMKHVIEQKHCGKTYEDALDPETNCFYCYFKENGTLRRTQKTEKELLQEQEEKNINNCIAHLKERNLIDEYTERVRQDPTKASTLNFFANSPEAYLNMLNSYIYEEWKNEQQIN